MQAVQQNARALEYAAPELQADRDIVLQAAQLDEGALAYGAPELQAGRDFMLQLEMNIITSGLS